MKKQLLTGLILFSTFGASANDLPAPMKQITAQGGEVISSFDAPENMTGYVVDFQGQALLLYATKSGEHIFTGSMLNADGERQGTHALEAYIKGEKNDRDWARLASTNWIADGSDDAQTIVYAFMDPSCPYCQRFWQAARPWVDAGKVQIRHIMVGIVSPDSGPKAAAILGANNPETALFEHESGKNPISADDAPSNEAQVMLQNNLQVMRMMGASATPTIFYKNKEGLVTIARGQPQGRQMDIVMGSSKD